METIDIAKKLFIVYVDGSSLATFIDQVEALAFARRMSDSRPGSSVAVTEFTATETVSLH